MNATRNWLAASAVSRFVIGILFGLTSVTAAEKKPNITIDWGKDGAPLSPNEPIPPPANLDPKYTAEALMTTFIAACKKAGFRIKTLAIDQSEFPFLLYGVLLDERDLRPIQDAVSSTADYKYVGSVTSRSNGFTRFAMNITPRDQYPRNQEAAVRVRVQERLKKLGGWRER